MATPKRYPVEIRERAVRMVAEHRRDYPSEWATIRSIAEKFGMKSETLRLWVRRAQIDDGPTARDNQRAARADPAARAGEPGAPPGQRNSQSRLCFFRAGARPATT